jgi:membrane-associated phospholipid phosphatase
MTEMRAPSTMTWQARLVWLVTLFGVQLLYAPINRTMQGGVILDTPWDAYVPFWPIWAVPYLLSLVWWAGCFVWAAWKMDGALYRAFVAATIAMMLTSYVVYILFPTYVQRPALEGSSWPIELVRYIYSNDRLHNAFPSGHTYTTMLILFFWWRWRPKLRWLWVGFAVVIILSTLFTGQHNLPDPIGGIVWAWAGYRFGLWWATRQS